MEEKLHRQEEEAYKVQMIMGNTAMGIVKAFVNPYTMLNQHLSEEIKAST